MSHGRHIFTKASDLEKATVYTYPQSDYAIPHWKYVLWFCAKCPCINMPDQETDNQSSKTTPYIRFHIYQIIGRCTIQGIIISKY